MVAPFIAAGLAWAGRAAVAAYAVEKIGGLIGTAASVLPRTTINVSVRVWGNRTATRRELESIASQVINIKLPQINIPNVLGIQNLPAGLQQFIPGGIGRILYGAQSQNTYDLVGRYVELTMKLNCGPITSFLTAPGAILHGMAGQFPALLDDDIAGVAVTADTPGYALPNGSGMRGTYIESCVAQALQNICGNPQTATLVGEAVRGGKTNLLSVPPTDTGTTTTTLTGTKPVDPPEGQPDMDYSGPGGSF